MQSLILASSSPRRKELLQFLQIPFESMNSNVDEDIEENMQAEDAVQELAVRKAEAIASRYPDSWVIGSDTVVVLEGEILGKPANHADGKRMLEMLSGKTHEVYTGVAILFGEHRRIFAVKTEVTFWELSESDIERYLDSGEPFDKAGSYGIQGLGSLLVKQINGDYFSVVGLPISRLARELKTMESELT
ncbi:Maf family protein [Peribacillus sp. NPDC097675]|uniref:Maf family protein n=1 Tax=Peribacillus sp. NPDC097675 TaxID=3390618 RepID=UPI003CFCE835